MRVPRPCRMCVPVAQSSAQPKSRDEVSVPPPEPFGQQGIGRFILPVLAMISLMIAAASGTMWWRSYYEADTFSRSDEDGRNYVVRSIMGRVLIYRVDVAIDAINPFAGSSWTYSNFPLTQSLPDGWQQSWKKTVGIEWQYAPLTTPPGTIGGFWMRIRWRTIVIVSSILPIVRLFQHYRGKRRERQRGFAVEDAS